MYAYLCLQWVEGHTETPTYIFTKCIHNIGCFFYFFFSSFTLTICASTNYWQRWMFSPKNEKNTYLCLDWMHYNFYTTSMEWKIQISIRFIDWNYLWGEMQKEQQYFAHFPLSNSMCLSIWSQVGNDYLCLLRIYFQWKGAHDNVKTTFHKWMYR